MEHFKAEKEKQRPELLSKVPQAYDQKSVGFLAWTNLKERGSSEDVPEDGVGVLPGPREATNCILPPQSR